MATPAADPKAAPLAEDLKEYAQTLATSAFPKNFFCASCSQLAVDSWKLLCCNKVVCSSCHAKLEFPTSCPLCDHSPLEAESCMVNKSLRNTMRTWLQKQKKKDEMKGTPQVATPPVEPTPTPAEEQPQEDAADKPVQSIEGAPQTEDAAGEGAASAGEHDGDASAAPVSAVPQSEENPMAPQTDDAQRAGSVSAQNPDPSVEPSAAPADPSAPPTAADGATDGTYDNSAMYNQMNGISGVPGQFGFGFPNQAGFGGMGMNGMPNMMGNAGWNGMNPMDFSMNMPNMPNGMYGGFGGNMGMPGMDMSAMWNNGGGFGNGWQGGMNGGGYENFNGYNAMGAYNQSGPQYPQMMNQFPKNNNPHQNRFAAHGNNRRGSQGNYGNTNSGPGAQQNAHSRPGSRSGPAQDREGEASAGTGEATTESEIKADGEQVEASTEAPEDGKATGDGTSEHGTAPPAQAEGDTNDAKELTGEADGANDTSGTNALNPIQTVDSVDVPPLYDQAMMNSAMQPMQSMQAYSQAMMGDFAGPGQNMNMPYGGNVGFNQHQHHGYGASGGYNAAYGSATVLTGEPRGVGVEGAPTGPRAMREGRPNTGFSSRMNNMRHSSHAPTPSVASVQDTVSASPARRGRGSPERDEALRVKDKSPSRSRSPRSKEDARADGNERSRPGDRESRHRRDRSTTPVAEDERHKERRHHRSSRYEGNDDRDERRDARDDAYDRSREEKDERGDRTRSTSVESKYRSRRDKEKHRSSRSHRDRSREHRRRHRSRSPIAEGDYEEDAHANGSDESRRRHRSDKEKHRERDRDRSRNRDDRERDRERRDRRDRDDRDYDYEREKDRSRDKDRDRKRGSRRDRDEEASERDYEDDKYRSSRRSRKDRDRDYDSSHTRDASPPTNAPTGPSAEKPEGGFSIKGFSKTKRTASLASASGAMPPPSGPRSFQPPKGPAADRDRDRRDSRGHKRNASVGSTTPTSPTSQDFYATERERHTRERVDKDNRDRVLQSIHGRATGRSNSSASASRPSLTSKRSRDDFDREEAIENRPEPKIPTGPAAHRDKRPRKDSSENTVVNLITQGLRKSAKSRRGGVKTESDAEKELERVERERDRRW